MMSGGGGLGSASQPRGMVEEPLQRVKAGWRRIGGRKSVPEGSDLAWCLR